VRASMKLQFFKVTGRGETLCIAKTREKAERYIAKLVK
jgi:hypothetical protein